MTKMVKYELKKILQSKLFIAVFLSSLAGMIAFSAVAFYQYKAGARGEYTLSDMKGAKMPEVFVSDDNINELRAKLTAFESNDEIYESSNSADYANGGQYIYSGKYEHYEQKQLLRLQKGEITKSEYNASLSKSKDPPFVIKKEYLPEYFKLLQPVRQYDEYVDRIGQDIHESKETYDDYTQATKVLNAEELNESPKTNVGYKRATQIMDAKKLRTALKKGFTVGYDYGWENIFSSFSNDSGILLAIVIIFGLCNVFTGEYSSGTDALLLSCKCGQRKTVAAKLLASLIYCAMCWAAYVMMTVVVNFAFLGAEGAGVGATQSNLEKFFVAIPCILLGCVLLGLVTLAVSALLSKQVGSIASSVLIGLLPLGADTVIYIPNVSVRQIIKVMPVNIIFGGYLDVDQYAYLNGRLLDQRLLFVPTAILVMGICIPIIYSAYCRHQVKN